MTALIIRLTMDILDLYAGLTSGLIDHPIGVIQSMLMFILPNLFAIASLIQLKKTMESRSRQTSPSLME